MAILARLPAAVAAAIFALSAHAADHLVRGFVEFEINPLHNERDLGRCMTDRADYGSAAAPCAAFGRYAAGGYLEFQPFVRALGRLPLERLFVFSEPNGYFGKNVPGVRYSASFEPILFEHNLGLGVELPKGFEFRGWLHFGRWLGRYSEDLGITNLVSKRPYGHYGAIALRKYYGGWGRERASAPRSSTPVARATFFPKNFARGFAEFEFDPHHNERDLGRCVSQAGNWGGANSPCTAFSRYVAGGYLEFQPFGPGFAAAKLQKFFLFMEPKVFFGKNVPFFRYSASIEPILLEQSLGLGVELPSHLDLRWYLHRNYWLGRYKGYVGTGDLGPSGPYGLFAAFSLRYYLGGWGRRP